MRICTVLIHFELSLQVRRQPQRGNPVNNQTYLLYIMDCQTSLTLVRNDNGEIMYIFLSVGDLIKKDDANASSEFLYTFFTS